MLLNLIAMEKSLAELGMIGGRSSARALVAWIEGNARQQDVGSLVLAGLAKQTETTEPSSVVTLFEQEKLGQPKSSSSYLVGRRFVLTQAGLEVLAAGEGKPLIERPRGGS